MEISFIHTQIWVHLHVNKTNFHMKGFALGLASKQRRNATRKSSIYSLPESILVVVVKWRHHANALLAHEDWMRRDVTTRRVFLWRHNMVDLSVTSQYGGSLCDVTCPWYLHYIPIPSNVKPLSPPPSCSTQIMSACLLKQFHVKRSQVDPVLDDHPGLN